MVNFLVPCYLQEDWDFLQLQCALYINSEMSGIPLNMQVSEGYYTIQYLFCHIQHLQMEKNEEN